MRNDFSLVRRWRGARPGLAGTTLLLAGLSAPTAAQESDWVQWATTNIQYLHGWDYNEIPGSELGEDRGIITVEHADGWKYGDNFFFVDISEPLNDNTEHYAEFSPRLSFGKISGYDLSFPLVKDVLLASTLEMGEDVRSYLIGPGFSLNLPYFAFADLNFYWRKSKRDFIDEDTDSGWQITFDWLLPFNIGGVAFAFEGFLDYAFDEEGGAAPKEDNLLTAPRLLIDVGNFFGRPNVLQAGVEYQIWRNQYGIDHENESVAQAMVKWILQ